MTWIGIAWIACVALFLELVHRAPVRDDME
jgi:hypothetical protein